MPMQENDRGQGGRGRYGATWAKDLDVGDYVLYSPSVWDDANPDPRQLDPRVWRVTMANKHGNTVDLGFVLQSDGVTSAVTEVDQRLPFIRVNLYVAHATDALLA